MTRLLAILAAPPLTTSGIRTLRRVATAGTLLGFEGTSIANLVDIPTRSVLDLSEVGAEERIWLAARKSIADSIDNATGVLLAYGAARPTGTAGTHHRNQLEWLSRELAATVLPVWKVGDSARHPSRWQRWTHRQHPDLPFAEALQASLIRVR